MISATDLNRIQTILSSIDGVTGFAVVLGYESKCEVLINNILPESAAQAIESTAEEYRTAVATEQPLRLN